MSAKIKLVGGEDIEVSLSTALKIKEQFEDEDIKPSTPIDISGKIRKKSKINGIDIGNGINTREKPYDLKNKEDRRIIKEFEKELEEAKKKPLKQPIEYYGKECKIIPAVNGMPKIEMAEGYVVNEIIGIKHAGVIQYMVEKKYIVKLKDKTGDYWAVTRTYDEWSQKYHALQELILRREQAENQEKQAMEQVYQAKKVIGKKI